MKSSWVYILLCSDGTYYTGCTTHLEACILQHHEGTFKGYTSERRPLKLIWSYEFSHLDDAILWERKIKGWSRKKKEALMAGRFDLIADLAQSKEMKERKKRRPRSITSS